MDNKTLFTLAHCIARSTAKKVGSYALAFKLALKEVRESKCSTLNETSIKFFETYDFSNLYVGRAKTSFDALDRMVRDYMYEIKCYAPIRASIISEKYLLSHKDFEPALATALCEISKMYFKGTEELCIKTFDAGEVFKADVKSDMELSCLINLSINSLIGNAGYHHFVSINGSKVSINPYYNEHTPDTKLSTDLLEQINSYVTNMLRVNIA